MLIFPYIDHNIKFMKLQKQNRKFNVANMGAVKGAFWFDADPGRSLVNKDIII